MLVSIFRLTHSTKGDDKAGGCITKRFHRKRIEWNTFDTPPPMRWPKSRYVYLRLPSQFLRFPVGSRLLPRIYADYALWNRATIWILFGFRVKERGREWICESEFLPSLELITRSLRRFIVSLLERSGREREGFLISNFLYLFKRSKWISIREINFFFNFLFIPFEWM